MSILSKTEKEEIIYTGGNLYVSTGAKNFQLPLF